MSDITNIPHQAEKVERAIRVLTSLDRETLATCCCFLAAKGAGETGVTVLGAEAACRVLAESIVGLGLLSMVFRGKLVPDLDDGEPVFRDPRAASGAAGGKGEAE